MLKYECAYQAYVADDGNYGVDTVVTFDYDLFHAEYPKAWEVLDSISDYSRVEVIIAILDQDEEELNRMAEEYEFNLADVLKH
jgi:hypothetical protein